MMGEFVETGNVTNVEARSLKTVDLLQQLLHEEIDRMAQGTLNARFFVDGGFEGEAKIDVREVRVRADGQKLIIEVDGYNGEVCFELQKVE